MKVYNSEIAKKFEDVADLLAIKGADEFRVRAYRDGARTVRRQSKSIEDMLNDGKDLSELHNIGKDLAGKMETIVKTGELPLLKKLKEQIPEELLKLLEIKGLGPERVEKLYRELDIKTVDDLKELIEKEKLRDVEGFGKKMEKNIKEAIKDLESGEERTLLKEAIEVVEPLEKYLNGIEEIEEVTVVGSYRRKKETVGDLDILIVSSQRENCFERILEYERIKDVQSKGKTKCSAILDNDIQVDFRLVDKSSKAAAKIYFTGSKSHNIELRSRAKDRGWKINEYGVFEGEKKFDTETEEEIYKKLDINYIPPELRENRGEIDAAKEGSLPNLIKVKDLKGDLQIHTKLSDGENNLEEIVDDCCKNEYEYLAITDHSSNIGVIRGVERGQIDQYIEKIREVDKSRDDIKIFAGVEVDILGDGRLFLQDHLLKQFDLVTFAIHSNFDMDEEDQTERILKAMDNKYVNIFAHPTGRMINKREPYRYNFEKVMKKAKENNIIVEINANPNRLDLNDIHAKAAKDIGVKFSISTDAHSISEMGFMKYGVWQARRGWIEKDDVVNTLGYDKFLEAIKR